MPIIVEVCLESVYSAIIAEKSGVLRIELCSSLDLGGITASQGLITAVCKAVNIPVFVLIRPRQGNFRYSNTELDVMVNDIEAAIEAGAKGIVSGALNNEYGVDKEATKRLIEATQGLPFTFHRAFDRATDPLHALQEIIELGASRILTSGQAATAAEGCGLIKTLVEKAGNSVVIMPGGGVTPDNVAQILETGAKEIHLSARAPVDSTKSRTNSSVSFNANGSGENQHYETSSDILKLLFEKINNQ